MLLSAPLTLRQSYVLWSKLFVHYLLFAIGNKFSRTLFSTRMSNTSSTIYTIIHVLFFGKLCQNVIKSSSFLERYDMFFLSSALEKMVQNPMSRVLWYTPLDTENIYQLVESTADQSLSANSKYKSCGVETYNKTFNRILKQGPGRFSHEISMEYFDGSMVMVRRGTISTIRKKSQQTYLLGFFGYCWSKNFLQGFMREKID